MIGYLFMFVSIEKFNGISNSEYEEIRDFRNCIKQQLKIINDLENRNRERNH